VTGLEELLAELFADKGALDAQSLAKKAMRDFRLGQRDARIYELRGSMTQAQLAERFSLTERRIKQIIRAQTRLRQSLKKVG